MGINEESPARHMQMRLLSTNQSQHFTLVRVVLRVRSTIGPVGKNIASESDRQSGRLWDRGLLDHTGRFLGGLEYDERASLAKNPTPNQIIRKYVICSLV